MSLCRTGFAALAASSLLLLGACATTPTEGIEPGDGPAVEATQSATDGELTPEDAKAALCSAYEPGTPEYEQFMCDDPGAFPTEDGATDEEVTEEPAEEETDTSTGTEGVATFKDKYTYEDGVEIEVTKIEHGTVTRADAEYSEELEGGEDWVKLTTRVKNNSSARISAYSSYTLTYGEDGESASTVYIDSQDTTDLSGKILPGKSKVSSEMFLLPAKSQEDVVLEYNFDMEHEAAIFSGSLAQ